MRRTIIALVMAVPLLYGAVELAAGPGCGTEHGKQKVSAAAKAAMRSVSGAEIGKEAVCPVTGEKLKVAKDTVSASYKGKKYYFCCPGCEKSFLADPEKYAAKKTAAAAYVCPMGHYQGDKPGKCPKCGMALAEKK